MAQSHNADHSTRVLIVTALSLEFLAVKDYLAHVEEWTASNGDVYSKGIFETTSNQYTIYVLETGMGNSEASSMTERAINNIQPHYAFFVGIAGGIKDVHYGDVVAADAVCLYESAKISDTHKPRPQSENCDHALIQRARAETRDRAKWHTLLKLGDSDAKPKAIVGTIVSGEKVIAETNTPIFELIKQSYSHAVAIEMEGYGFLQACNHHRTVQPLVIRGISDLISRKDATDTEGWQNIAARNAAAFCFAVLQGLPFATLPSFSRANSAQSVTQLCEQVKAISIQIEAHNGIPKDEIKRAKQLLRDHNTVEAKASLEFIQRNYWDAMETPEKASLLTQLAHIALLDGHIFTCGSLIVEANQLAPDSLEMQCNLVTALRFTGKVEDARQLAEQLVARESGNLDFWTAWIQCQDDNTDVLKVRLPENICDSSDAIAALAHFHLKQGNYENAEELSGQLIANTPDSHFGWALKGQAILAAAINQSKSKYSDHEKHVDAKHLQEAETCFTQSIEIASRKRDSLVWAESLQKRSVTRRLLGKENEGQLDVQSFVAMMPGNPVSLYYQACEARKAAKSDEARDLLAQAAGITDCDAGIKIAYAEALIESDLESHKSHAQSLLTEIVLRSDDVDVLLRLNGIALLVESFASVGSTDELTGLLNQCQKCAKHDHISAIAAAYVARRSGEMGASRELCRTIARDIDAASHPQEARYLAGFCIFVGELETAMHLLIQSATLDVLGQDAMNLLNCAEELKRDDILLSVIRELRLNAVWDTHLLSREVLLLQQYDPLEAIELLQGVIRSNPVHELHARVMLCYLGIQLRQRQLCTLTPDMLNDLDGYDTSLTFQIPLALRASGYAKEATELAHELLRNNYSDPLARKAFIQTAFPYNLMESAYDPPIPQNVDVDCAVKYELGGSESWAVILEHKPCLIELLEHHISEPFVSRLLGLRREDEFEVEVGGIKQKGVILDIISKHVFRYRRIIEEVSDHPDENAFLIRVKVRGDSENDENWDFSELMEMGKRVFKQQQYIDDIFNKGMCSFYLVERNTLTGTLRIMNNPDISCPLYSGHQREIELGKRHIDGADRIIVDLSSIGALMKCGALHVLSCFGKKLLISHHAYQEVMNTVEAVKGSAGSLIFTDSGFIVRPTCATDEVYIQHLMDTINLHCKISGCQELAAIDHEWRSRVQEVIGLDGMEAVALSARHKYCICTEDRVVHHFCKELNTEPMRICAYNLLEYARSTSFITPEAFKEHVARLILAGQVSLSYDYHILYEMARLTEFEPRAAAFRAALLQLRDAANSISITWNVSMGFLSLIYREPLEARVRDAYADSILSVITERHDAALVRRLMLGSVRQFFGLNLLGAQAFELVLSSWGAIER